MEHEQRYGEGGDREGNWYAGVGREPRDRHRQDEYCEDDWVPHHVLRHRGQIRSNCLITHSAILDFRLDFRRPMEVNLVFFYSDVAA